ncbi:MAG: NOG1 family protein [Thermoplasmata archaeon]
MFRLPPVPTAQELLDRGFRASRKVRGTGRTALERARSRALQSIGAFGKPIRTGLQRVYTSFPSIDPLPAFNRELLDVIAGIDETKRNLGSLSWAREQVLTRAQDARRTIRASASREEIERASRAFHGRVASVLRAIDPSLTFLREARGNLRRVPGVNPDLRTLVIAGSPNVGKSQLVQALSRARPTVATYPFTTQDLALGHFTVEGRRFQVMDTPGLLDRPVSKRNEVERKALVALRHVADLIVFLLDPTGTSGYPLEEQEALLTDLRSTFPATPFLEVENKADLGAGTGTRRRISALTGRGVQGLVREAVQALTNPAPASAPQRSAG